MMDFVKIERGKRKQHETVWWCQNIKHATIWSEGWLHAESVLSWGVCLFTLISPSTQVNPMFNWWQKNGELTSLSWCRDTKGEVWRGWESGSVIQEAAWWWQKVDQTERTIQYYIEDELFVFCFGCGCARCTSYSSSVWAVCNNCTYLQYYILMSE